MKKNIYGNIEDLVSCYIYTLYSDYADIYRAQKPLLNDCLLKSSLRVPKYFDRVTPSF